MRLRFIAALLLCCLPIAASAQMTTVTATVIRDGRSASGLLPNGKLCMTGIDATKTAAGSKIGGGGQDLGMPYCAAITNGALAASLSVPDSCLTAPVIGYKIEIFDGYGKGIRSYLTQGCVVTGTAWSFDSFIPSSGSLESNRSIENLSVKNLTCSGIVSGCGPGGGGSLGYTPLDAAKNLSDLASASTARTNLGVTYNNLPDRPTLSAVATSGSYSDLSSKPTIPTSSNWPNAGSCASQVVTGLTNGAIPTCSNIDYTGSIITNKPTIPVLSTTAPSMDGSASYGSATTAARADHVHPTDTTRAGVTNPAIITGSSLSAGAGSGTSIPGSSLTVGSAYYQGTSGLALAQANAAGTTPAICIAVTTTSCMYNGVFRYSASQSWTVGGVVYLSAASSGALTQTAPSTSGQYVQRVGVALAADTLLIMPSSDVGGIQ